MGKEARTCETALKGRHGVSAQHRDETVKRLRGCLLILHHRDADVAASGIRSVGLLAREIAARHHAQPRLTPKSQRHGLVPAPPRHAEPQEKSAFLTPIPATQPDTPV